MKRCKSNTLELLNSLLLYESSYITALLKKILTKKGIHQIISTNKTGYQVIDINDIVIIKKNGNVTTIYLKDGSVLPSTESLNRYEAQLGDNLPFFKIEQSCLINLTHINEFIHKSGKYLIMSNRIKIPIANEKYEQLLKKISTG